MTKTEFEIYAVKTAKEFLEAEYTEKQTILSYKKRFPNIEQALEKFEALKNDGWESLCLIIVRDRTSFRASNSEVSFGDSVFVKELVSEEHKQKAIQAAELLGLTWKTEVNHTEDDLWSMYQGETVYIDEKMLEKLKKRENQ